MVNQNVVTSLCNKGFLLSLKLCDKIASGKQSNMIKALDISELLSKSQTSWFAIEVHWVK